MNYDKNSIWDHETMKDHYKTGSIGYVDWTLPYTSKSYEDINKQILKSIDSITTENNTNITLRTKDGREVTLDGDLIERLVVLLEVIQNLDDDNDLKVLFLTTFAMKKLGAE